MVDASELAFRLLCREHGAELAYTPMLNARLMATEPAYVSRHYDAGGTSSEDRPLVTQLAGHDPGHLATAARLCSADSLAIDLNLGCPQEIALSGRYGAFLLEEEPEVALRCVRALVAATSRPVTAKMRLQATRERTVEIALRLQEAGVSALTLHGRTRLQTRRQRGIGSADWDAVREVARALTVPVVSNGGIASAHCVVACLEHTAAQGVMVGEALLENPALFMANRRHDGTYIDQDALAARYLELCEAHPPRKGIGLVKDHCRRMLHNGWLQWPDLADELYVATDLAAVTAVVGRLAARGWVQPAFHTNGERQELSWYARRRERHDVRPNGDAHSIWVGRYLARSAAKRHGAARKRLAKTCAAGVGQKRAMVRSYNKIV